MTNFKTITRRQGLVGAVALAGALAAGPALAQDYFAGRTIDLVVPAGAGGSYGLYALLVAEHMPRHIPGNPTITPNYMGGAGGLRAANYVGTVAEADGSTMFMMHQNTATAQLLQPDAAQFDAATMPPIGTLSAMNSVMVVRSDSGVDAVEDALETRVVTGSTGRGSYQYVVPTLLNDFLGTQFQVITTYPGTGETTLAFERGEIQGLMTSIATVIEGHPGWLDGTGSGQIILQVGGSPDPLIPDVPLLTSLAQDDEQRATFNFLSLSNAMARSLVMPTGTSDEVVGILRTAFEDMMNDPEYQAAATELGLPLAWSDHEELAGTISQILATPQDVVDLTARISAD